MTSSSRLRFSRCVRVAILLAVAAMLSAPVLRAQHSAVIPAPRGDQWSKQRFDELLERVKESGPEAKLVFLGDSITQGWEGAGREVWERYYGDRDALNLGIGGDRTQHVLWRLAHGHSDGLYPGVVVLMIGTNNSNGEDNTPGQIVDGVSAIVADLRERMPAARILLLGIFPRGENFNAQRGKILQVNQVLRKLADNEHIYWLDFGHEFLEVDGRLPAEIMPDYLHLSTRGYEVWAEAMEPLLAQLLGDTPHSVAGEAAGLTGQWTWTITGPDGQPVSAPLILTQTGSGVTGRFARGPDGWLNIEDGRADGTSFRWIVKRDRSDGGVMVYRMTGTLDGDAITGTVTTEMDGAEVTSEWSARRD